MRTRTKVALGAAVAAAIAAGAFVPLVEAHGPGWGRGMMTMGPARQLFDQADADDDAKLSRGEIDAFAAGRLQAHDADGNGALGLDEFDGLWAELTRPVQVRAFQFADADGDGRITAEEMRRPLDRALERMDRDGDGALALDELGRRGGGRHHGRD